MHRLILNLFLLLISIKIFSQKTSDVLIPGKSLVIKMDIKNSITQQAGSQAINFSASGTVMHHFTCTNAGESQILHHELDRLSFQFLGMGQQRSFDSENKEDRKGDFGKQFDELLQKKYDVTIDATGKIVRAVPEKIALTSPEAKMVFISDMLKDLTGVIYPPKKGERLSLYVLPANATPGVGDTWSDSTETENEKSVTIYTLSAITDSSIVIDYKTNSVSSVQTETMGRQAKTNLSSITTGTISLDKNNYLLRKKTGTTESSGTTEAMGGKIPINGTTSITITVQQ